MPYAVEKTNNHKTNVQIYYCCDRKVAWISTGIPVKESKTKKNKDIIKDKITIVNDIIKKYRKENDDVFPPTKYLMDALKNSSKVDSDKKEEDIFILFDEFMEWRRKYKAKFGKYSESTEKNWKVLLNYMKVVIGSKPIKLVDINADFVFNFQNHLFSIGLADISTHSFVIYLRAFLNWLTENEKIKPLKEEVWNMIYLKISKEKSRKQTISMEELEFLLKKRKTLHSDGLNLVLDMFLFSILVGISYGDLLKLDETNIEDGYVLYYRQKTRQKAKPLLGEEAYNIFKDNNFCFPWNKTLQTYNDYVCNILSLFSDEMPSFGKTITISKFVNHKEIRMIYRRFDCFSSHCPRHSFVSLNKAANMSEDDIKLSIGDKTTSVVRGYNDAESNRSGKNNLEDRIKKKYMELIEKAKIEN